MRDKLITIISSCGQYCHPSCEFNGKKPDGAPCPIDTLRRQAIETDGITSQQAAKQAQTLELTVKPMPEYNLFLVTCPEFIAPANLPHAFGVRLTF